MAGSRKEEILLAALELAAQKGLGNVSVSMIAEKVGIRKASLYNHFASKEELIKEMYRLLRERAKQGIGSAETDYDRLLLGKTVYEVLTEVLGSYQRMNRDENMRMLYKVVYSERSREPAAAWIMAEETEKMIGMTKRLFQEMEKRGMLQFSDCESSAVSFALTVHGLMEYEEDLLLMAEAEEQPEEVRLRSLEKAKIMMQEYLRQFCRETRGCR